MKTRRKHERFIRRLEVAFSADGKDYVGISSDFSCNGLFIRTNHSFPPGMVINITIYLPDTTTSVLTGIVKRAIKTPTVSLKNGMGIEIIRYDDNYIRFMSTFAVDCRKDGFVSAGPSGPRETIPDIGIKAGDTPAEFLMITCQDCGVRNKILITKISHGPKCGKCGSVLKQNSDRSNEKQAAPREDRQFNGNGKGASAIPSQDGQFRGGGDVIVVCPNCGIKNKLSQSKMSLSPKCGKCRSLLNNNSGPCQKEKVISGVDQPSDKHGKSAPPASSPGEQSCSIGDIIAGRYQIQDIFGGEGRSAMGIVYMCYDIEHDKVLALKTLQKRYLDSKKIVDSFKKEALAWIHLGNHPYIVSAYWVRELDARMFIACEYISPDIEGRNSLTPYLDSPFSLKRTLTWAIQFCHGMEYACSKGITPHRDIKPDNIMITQDGDIKISDFGLAGLWDKTEKSDEIHELIKKNQKGLTFLSTYNNRIVAGSPPWMSPEQFYGVAETGSDIYSFGIVLFQMVNRGELPFRPREGDKWGTAHKRYPVPPIPAQGEALADIIKKCLEKRRDMRYKDFGELREDLEMVFKDRITKKTGEKPVAAPVLEKIRESDIINKGMSLANLGLIEEGIKKYREGLKINPDNASAHYNLGNALVQKGLLEQAIKEYREAIRVDPELTAAHFNLGMTLFREERLDEAIREYKEAIRTNPEFEEAYVNLGVAYHKKGLIDHAVRAYKEAVKINPYFAEAYFKLGITYFAKDLLDEAVEAYENALRIQPEYSEAHNNLGVALFKKGLADEAISACRQAIKIKPGYADAYYNLGMVFIKKELRNEAVSAFEEFINCSLKQDSRIEKAKEFIRKYKGLK